jgi:hypothetical protein
MQIKSFFLLIGLLFLLSPARTVFAQTAKTYAKIDSLESCENDNLAFPIHVKNLQNVDSFNLVIGFNPSVIDFQSYSQLNDSLLIPGTSIGNFSLTELNGIITINWYRDSAFNLTDDTLLFLNFNSINGNSGLTWDTQTAGNCIFHCIGDTLLNTQFIDGFIMVNSLPKVVLTELNETCKGKCDANFMATVTGGTRPYLYLWNGQPGRFDSIQTNLCDSINVINIIDSKGCVLDSTYLIEGLPGPMLTVEMKCDGVVVKDSLYRENPVLTFRIETDDPIQPPFEWDFGDGLKATTNDNFITHVYGNANNPDLKKYILSLTVVNANGCDSTYKITITIKDDSIVKINNVLVPTGNDKNRVFVIANKNDSDWTPLIHQFRNIEVVIFDRWGRKVYANNDYQCDWRADGLPDGVYFYVVKVIGFFNTQVHKGSLTIIGSKN